MTKDSILIQTHKISLVINGNKLIYEQKNSQISSSALMLIISEFFKEASVSREAEELTVLAERDEEPGKKATSEQTKAIIRSQVSEPSVIRTGSRKLPVVSNHSMMTPIGDLLGGKQEPDLKKGMRLNDAGEVRFKTSYKCQCGKNGVRYVPEGAEFAKCHSCYAEMKIKPITDPNEEGHNGYGVYYRAAN